MPIRLDLAGKKYNYLLVIGIDRSYKGNYYRRCKCDCGKEVVVLGSCIKSGHTKSCGCKKIQCAKNNFTIHGYTGYRIYHIWENMNARCNNKNNPKYVNWGGRGIQLLWNTFEEFIGDMLCSYLDHVEKFGEKQTSIDRIDNNGNYCKENCRWATMKEQIHNSRRYI